MQDTSAMGLGQSRGGIVFSRRDRCGFGSGNDNDVVAHLDVIDQHLHYKIHETSIEIAPVIPGIWHYVHIEFNWLHQTLQVLFSLKLVLPTFRLRLLLDIF